MLLGAPEYSWRMLLSEHDQMKLVSNEDFVQVRGRYLMENCSAVVTCAVFQVDFKRACALLCGRE